jgi:hypothetical protein
MPSGVVLVQPGEDGRERLARMQFLRGLRILGVHVHDEVGVFGKKRHLTFCVATIGAMRVGLDKLPDRKTIRGFGGIATGDVPLVLVSFKDVPLFPLAAFFKAIFDPELASTREVAPGAERRSQRGECDVGRPKRDFGTVLRRACEMDVARVAR